MCLFCHFLLLLLLSLPLLLRLFTLPVPIETLLPSCGHSCPRVGTFPQDRRRIFAAFTDAGEASSLDVLMVFFEETVRVQSIENGLTAEIQIKKK